MITAKRLRKLLRYERRTGLFYWRVDRALASPPEQPQRNLGVASDSDRATTVPDRTTDATPRNDPQEPTSRDSRERPAPPEQPAAASAVAQGALDTDSPIIEFGVGWAKIHFRREVTDQDRAILIAAFTPTHNSPPVRNASQNSAERNPSVMPDLAGGEAVTSTECGGGK